MFADTLKQEIQQLWWCQCIDLGNGIVTPGEWGAPNPLIIQAFADVDWSGKKVLDVGCWDGLWSFEAEKRGAAAVYSVDYVPDSQIRDGSLPTYSLAHSVLNSKAQYFPKISVYDLTAERLGASQFDVVIYCGVYYHLKSPLLALARLRRLLKDGGLIIVEGPVISNSVENIARFYYSEQFGGDQSNWWVPTSRCLWEWLECSFFEIVTDYCHSGFSGLADRSRRRTFGLTQRIKRALKAPPSEFLTRYVVVARARRGPDPNQTPEWWPDADLKDFFNP